jgi:hypothetical protein
VSDRMQGVRAIAAVAGDGLRPVSDGAGPEGETPVAPMRPVYLHDHRPDEWPTIHLPTELEPGRWDSMGLRYGTRLFAGVDPCRRKAGMCSSKRW